MQVLQRDGDLFVALDTALEQYKELIGEPFPTTPHLDLHKDTDFWALVEQDGNELVIRIGGGVLPNLHELWNNAFADGDFVAGVMAPFFADKAEIVHVSLVWLVLHEMQHFVLGHFDIVGRAFLSETERGARFALSSRDASKPSLLDDLGVEKKPMVELCLELQADHDAIELVLDAYSTGEWPSLRARIAAIAAIAAMKVLIERADAKLVETHSSHPKAATRIFQLLGHVIEMPLIPAHRKAVLKGTTNVDPDDIPSEEEHSAFNREVVIPSFFDSLNLARVAGADSIRSDLGEAADFFRDVQTAKMGDLSTLKSFRTLGARQWAELMAVNKRVNGLFAQYRSGI